MKYAICIKNKGYEVSLEVGKLYQVIYDSKSAKKDLVRIVDESGEDYLFPKKMFVSIKIPKKVENALTLARNI